MIEHPACVIFTQCDSNQLVVEVLPWLAMTLYLERIISEMVLPRVHNSTTVQLDTLPPYYVLLVLLHQYS